MGPNVWAVARPAVPINDVLDAVVAAARVLFSGPDLDELSDEPVSPESLRDELDLTSLPLRTRTVHALGAVGVTQVGDLRTMAVGDLLAVPNAGVVTLFDLGVVLEEAANRGIEPSSIQPTGNVDDDLRSFVEWVTRNGDSPAMSRPIDLAAIESRARLWPGTVDSADPRFAEAFEGTLWTSVREVLAASDPDYGAARREVLTLLHDEVERIRQLPLEQQIHDLLSSVGGRSVAGRVEQLGKRWGTTGLPPATLEKTGKAIGVSRERVRQIEVKVRKQLPPDPFVPALDTAIAAIQEAAPISVAEVPTVVSSAVHSNVDYCWEAIQSLVELLRRDIAVEDVALVTGERILVPGDGRSAYVARTAHQEAIKQSLAYGATNIEEVKQAVSDDTGSRVDSQLVEDALSWTDAITIRADGWLWCHPDGRYNSFAERTKLMLAVNEPLTVRSLREGLRRRAAFLQEPLVPPTDVLASVYESLSEFSVDGDLVSSTEPVSGLVNEDEVKWKMVRILNDAPEQIIDRVSFLEACQEAGINLNTANVYMTYLAEIEHVAPNVWAARGTQVDTGAIVALQERTGASTPSERATGWTTEGRPWMAVLITPTTWSSGVFYVPAELSVIRGSSFEAFTAAGTQVGTVAVAQSGQSWGWSSYMRRTGAEAGDVLRATFDIVERTVAVEIGDLALLE